MYRAVASIAVAAVLLVVASPLARADSGPGSGDNRGWKDKSGVGATASQQLTPVPAGSRVSGSGGKGSCTYSPLDSAESGFADDAAAQGLGPAKGSGPGGWYRKDCVDANGMRSGIVVWVPRPAPAVATPALAQQALGYTPMPPPGMGMNPRADREQLVNLTTFLWLDQAQWRPVSASASAAGVTVVTTAVPQRVVWSMGTNGESVTCEGPGVPYDPSKSDADQPDPCRFVYRRSSAGQPNGAFTVTATVTWHVTWAASGVPAGQPAAGDLGVVTRSSSVPVRVAEAEATDTNG